MSTLSRHTRTYRLFSVAAVAHAALLLAALSWVINDHSWRWYTTAWVGLTTLWFFWPVILALHAGRSARRAYVALAIAAVIIALPMQLYCSFLAPHVFMPDEMVRFSPYDIGPFAIGYVRGWAAAKRRRDVDPIILEGYGMGGGFTPGAPPFTAKAREKYRLEVQPVAMCVVNPYLQGHAKGYNRVSVEEIERRYGAGVIPAAEQEEGARQHRYTDMQNAGRADAGRDLRSGRLAVLIHGPAITGEQDYKALLQDRFGVELRRASAEIEDGESDGREDVWAHVSGYNEVSSAEIRQRFGEEAATIVFCVTQRQSYDLMLQRLEWERDHSAHTAAR